MEKIFFEWEAWDQSGTMSFMFYDPTLKVDVGRFKAGQTLSWASIDYDKGELHLGETEQAEAEIFKIKLVLEEN